MKSGQDIKADRLYRVRKGDFIYNRLFAWKGSFAVACEEFNDCYVSNEFPCFEIRRDRLDSKFLLWYFRRESIWAEALGLSSGATPTSRNRLKERDLLDFQLPLPSLDEQRRVAARIEDLAVLISEGARIQRSIAADQDMLLRSAFRRIADRAPRKAMREVAPLERRPVQIDPAKSYPQVAVRSFGRGTFHRPPLAGESVTWQKPFLVKSGDILISNIKAWEGAIAVARAEDDGHVGSHRYLTFVPIPQVATSRFVCFYLLTPEGLGEVSKASPGSADRNRTLSSTALQSIPIPVPGFDEQVWFDRLCGEMTEAKRLQAETAAELDALLPAILDRAFKGELV